MDKGAPERAIKSCLSTNIFAANVQRNLRPWCRAHERPSARAARAPASSNSFRCSASPHPRLNRPVRPRGALVAPAAIRVVPAPVRLIPRLMVPGLMVLQSNNVAIHGGGALTSCTIKSQLYGGYSSAVELRTVAPAVVGSNPTTHQ